VAGREAAMKTRVFMAGIAALFLATGAAHAADKDYCAVVLKTPDGSLSFRKGPDKKSELRYVLLPGEILYVDAGATTTKKNWVFAFPFNIRPPQRHRTFMPNSYSPDVLNPGGWVYSKFIQRMDVCPPLPWEEEEDPKQLTSNGTIPGAIVPYIPEAPSPNKFVFPPPPID
jgi:hypothetical protein